MRRAVVVPVTVFVTVFVTVVMVGACGGDDDDDAGESSSTSVTAATTTTAAGADDTTPPDTTAAVTAVTPTTIACAAPLAAPPGPVDGPVPPEGATLQDVEFATSDGCAETVTFSFDSPVAEAPGYRVEYQAGPFAADGSGEPVAVEGAAFLLVRFEPAWGYDFERNEVTYTGPDRIDGGGLVTEVVQLGDFEGVVTWVIGLSSVRAFTVDAAGGPDHHVAVSVT